MQNLSPSEESQILDTAFSELPEIILSNGVSSYGWYNGVPGENNVIYMKEKVVVFNLSVF